MKQLFTFEYYTTSVQNARGSSFASYDLSQTSHCDIKALSVGEVMRIENMITQVQLY